MNNVANPPPRPDRWRPGWDVTVRRAGLLADLGLALVALGRSSRLVLESSGQVALSVPDERGPLAVAVVQDARGGWAYVWGAAARYPAGADGTRHAASALAAGTR
ncbi:hypothetical protein [Actinomadura sp. CNU-125]|uniref:hypothetical protein n=1 Tax=Actinomadura sp. CNU-125 TaxID=1904961 RepID=UPI0013018F40|nr:hypothetical protein [Actinomadura sp. CNU-125]